MDYRFVKTFEFNFNFGTLLSIDFSSCCEETDLFNLTEEVFNEIKDSVKNRGIPDLIWLKGVGDSIKNANTKEIIATIKKNYPNQKVGMYLNCALFEDEETRAHFYQCDVVAINLNSVDFYNFAKINKCPRNVNPLDILDGIIEFRRNFDGELGIYTLFLNGVNDNMKTVEKMKDFLLKAMPDHYSVSNYTLDGYKIVSDEFKKKIEETLRYVPFKVMYMF